MSIGRQQMLRRSAWDIARLGGLDDKAVRSIDWEKFQRTGELSEPEKAPRDPEFDKQVQAFKDRITLHGKLVLP